MATATSVTIVNSNEEVEEKGSLFAGKRFFVGHRCPQRSRYVIHIKNNGGQVLVLEKDIDVFIADHLRADSPPNSISYTWIEKCLETGRLESFETHRAGPSAGEPRPVGAVQPRKLTRTPFSQEDDEFLYRWVKDYLDKGGATYKGNELYKQIGQANGRHPWQAWRARYVQVLSMKPPLNLSKPAPMLTGEQPPRPESGITKGGLTPSEKQGALIQNEDDSDRAPQTADRPSDPDVTSNIGSDVRNKASFTASQPTFHPPPEIADDDRLFLRDDDSDREQASTAPKQKRPSQAKSRDSQDSSPYKRKREERSESPFVLSHKRIDPTWRPRSLFDSSNDRNPPIIKDEARSPDPYIPSSPLQNPQLGRGSASPMFLPDEVGAELLNPEDASQPNLQGPADATVTQVRHDALVDFNHSQNPRKPDGLSDNVDEAAAQVKKSVVGERSPAYATAPTSQSQTKSTDLLTASTGFSEERQESETNHDTNTTPNTIPVVRSSHVTGGLTVLTGALAVETDRAHDINNAYPLRSDGQPSKHYTQERDTSHAPSISNEAQLPSPHLTSIERPSKRRKSSLTNQGQRLSLNNSDLALDEVDVSSFTVDERDMLRDAAAIIQEIPVGKYNDNWRVFANEEAGKAHSAAEWKAFYELEILPEIEKELAAQGEPSDLHPLSYTHDQNPMLVGDIMSPPLDEARAESTTEAAKLINGSSISVDKGKLGGPGSSQQNISRKRRRYDGGHGDGDQASESQYFSAGSIDTHDMQQSSSNTDDAQAQDPEANSESNGSFRIFEFREVDEVEQENVHANPPSQHPFRASGEALQFTEQGIHFRLEPMEVDDDEEEDEAELDEDEDDEDEQVGTHSFAKIQEEEPFSFPELGIQHSVSAAILDTSHTPSSRDDTGQDDQRGDEDGFVQFDLASQTGDNTHGGTSLHSQPPPADSHSVQVSRSSPSPVDIDSDAESEAAFETAPPPSNRKPAPVQDIYEIDFEVPGPPDEEQGFISTDRASVVKTGTNQTSSQKLTPVRKPRSLPWQRRAETEDTQAILNAPTQLPELTIPGPPDDPNDDASTPSSETLMPVSSPGRPVSSHTDSGDAYIESFISQQEQRGFGATEALYALKRATLDWELALRVLESLRAGKGVPQNVPGIWTEEEDQILQSGNAVEMRKLEVRHGKAAFDARLDGIDELAEDNYDDDDDDEY